MTLIKRLIYLSVGISLLTALFGPASASASAVGAARLQPELAEQAARSPEQPVAVIVQKAESSSRPETLVAQLGGAVTKDLHIINAFAAVMRADAALQLAASPSVRWISLDAPAIHAGHTTPAPTIDTSALQNAFIPAVGADRVWNEGPAYLRGQGVTVAVVDSGNCAGCVDLLDANNHSRMLAAVSVVPDTGTGSTDAFGHGSLIEGVLGNNGAGSNYKYMGVAPAVNLVSVRIANDEGQALSSDVVNGLQWVLANKSTYNIRVVSLSLNSAALESYQTSPIDAAVEILWFNSIVVVVSAGNNGAASLYAPANDPFVVTVGATDDKGTASLSDDSLAPFSAYGQSENGLTKPDLVAPGVNLISFVRKSKNKIWKDHPNSYTGDKANKGDSEYFMRVSGTSFSAPIVAGAAAILLQHEPNLTPDQVKYRLTATANKGWPGYNAMTAGAGVLDIFAAVHATTTQSANAGIPASHLLWTGSAPITWSTVNWNTVNWNTVNWNTVNWNTVNWNTVNWNGDYWGP